MSRRHEGDSPRQDDLVKWPVKSTSLGCHGFHLPLERPFKSRLRSVVSSTSVVVDSYSSSSESETTTSSHWLQYMAPVLESAAETRQSCALKHLGDGGAHQDRICHRCSSSAFVGTSYCCSLPARASSPCTSKSNMPKVGRGSSSTCGTVEAIPNSSVNVWRCRW